jgi:hypothetical protein
MKKIVLVTLIVMAIASIIMMGERFYWRYWPFTPIVVSTDKIKILNPDHVVVAGSLMFYEVTFDKKMPGACTIRRQLINSYRIDYDAGEPPEKELGPQKAKASIHVPQGTDAGEWFMRWTAECPVGPDKRMISVTRECEKFRVVSNLIRGPKGEPGKNFWGK